MNGFLDLRTCPSTDRSCGAWGTAVLCELFQFSRRRNCLRRGESRRSDPPFDAHLLSRMHLNPPKVSKILVPLGWSEWPHTASLLIQWICLDKCFPISSNRWMAKSKHWLPIWKVSIPCESTLNWNYAFDDESSFVSVPFSICSFEWARTPSPCRTSEVSSISYSLVIWFYSNVK